MNYKTFVVSVKCTETEEIREHVMYGPDADTVVADASRRLNDKWRFYAIEEITPSDR